MLNRSCSGLEPNVSSMAGKITLCFGTDSTGSYTVGENGGLGVIVATTSGSNRIENCSYVPCVFVDYQIGTQMLAYFRSSRYTQLSCLTQSDHF